MNAARWARVVLLLCGAALALLLIFRLNRQITRLHALQREEERLSTAVAHLTATVQALEAQLTQAASEAQVETWAHGEAHWVREGEMLLIPQPDEPTPTATGQPAPLPTPATPIARWQLWWALFFGSVP